ncbi:LpxL/LpxP family Kdo(2)-lipid IV(A) lauroyl/palmitoleoyl acyltransferase [Vibrio sp. SM6]|uniref:Lipid A biosynthesis acyltransferase n=1 Tax=Vibrio agarilyticus TaxID=2726741 RepID=A0A7X8YIQ9_9VIBR|nr:LpxL/LpxP family Kdo(2)-lipid IV(A) lauroyl/palmitoleoyl acyltransferase [Vibrio agarilyticus]NLS14846.1 LpxL/LpxP family Kdo(2)-lipid IV(A) lauroyl/palmitoleoyl acyltransferase [Vibrio agarilyticus]
MKKQTSFSLALCHPKYWLVWFGFGLLALAVNLLPYPLIRALGRGFGLLGMRLAKSRVHVARRNLELAFPAMSSTERDAIVIENFKNSGLALFETGMAWFWPTWRVLRHATLPDTEQLNACIQQKRGVMIVCPHTLNLEFTARIYATFIKGYGVYRPHNNPAYDFIQRWGRSRFGHVMIDRKDLKGMINALNSGGCLWYMPDHDYGRRKSVFVPFFAVEDACTTTGTSLLFDETHCAVMTSSGFRHGSTYQVILDPDISEQFNDHDPEGVARAMNKGIETVILRGIDQWMWLHKRFKTMRDPNLKSGIRYQ